MIRVRNFVPVWVHDDIGDVEDKRTITVEGYDRNRVSLNIREVNTHDEISIHVDDLLRAINNALNIGVGHDDNDCEIPE